MSSTAGDEGQGGRFGAKEIRTRRLPLAAIFHFCFCADIAGTHEGLFFCSWTTD